MGYGKFIPVRKSIVVDVPMGDAGQENVPNGTPPVDAQDSENDEAIPETPEEG